MLFAVNDDTHKQSLPGISQTTPQRTPNRGDDIAENISTFQITDTPASSATNKDNSVIANSKFILYLVLNLYTN